MANRPRDKLRLGVLLLAGEEMSRCFFLQGGLIDFQLFCEGGGSGKDSVQLTIDLFVGLLNKTSDKDNQNKPTKRKARKMRRSPFNFFIILVYSINKVTNQKAKFKVLKNGICGISRKEGFR